jgi:hypothetical protein
MNTFCFSIKLYGSSAITYRKLNATDLVSLEAITLDELFNVCEMGTPTANQMELLKMFQADPEAQSVTEATAVS